MRFSVNSVAWSPDGDYIATGSAYSREIHVWNVRSRTIVRKLSIPYPPPAFHQLAWSPDGLFLAACDGTNVLRIYDTRTWEPAHVFRELHDLGACDHPAFSSDSKRIAVIGVRLVEYSVPDWSMLGSASLREGWAKGDLFNAVAYVPRTHTVLVGGGQYIRDPRDRELEPWDGRVWFFCPGDNIPCRNITVYPRAGGHAGGGPVAALATSPDGRTAVAATNSGVMRANDIPVEPVHVIRLSDGATVGAPLDHMIPYGAAVGLAYTADNTYIIVGHEQVDGAIHIVNAESYAVEDFIRAGGFVSDIAVNQRNKEFAVGAGNKVLVWSLPR